MARNKFEEPRNRWFIVIIWVLMLVYLFTYVAYLITALNIRFTHTYQIPPGAPGVLTSDRYTIRWFFIVFGVGRLFLLGSVIMLLICSNHSCCLGMWMIIVILLWAVDFGIVFFLTRDHINCNTNGNPANLCNDILYCCPTEHFTNPTNNCQNVLQCATPIARRPDITNPFVQVSDLKPHEDWYWIYMPAIAFLAADTVIVMLVVIILFREPALQPDNAYPRPYPNKVPAPVEPIIDDDDYDEGGNEDDIPLPPPTSIERRVVPQVRRRFAVKRSE